MLFLISGKVKPDLKKSESIYDCSSMDIWGTQGLKELNKEVSSFITLGLMSFFLFDVSAILFPIFSFNFFVHNTTPKLGLPDYESTTSNLTSFGLH